ncbi:MFS transporter [Fluoribacter dumoffii]|uniref:MFS transporter n=1 Tax=Fluoribacter dumoffii TaxID=463 RepID=UPI00026C7846|nr:MFS transporter [Fluoribacter dumoffii]MCW8386891.1 MFS transporter [Fluoribacter dumoffii]MCW8417604.1 MFS transporter [Fluoribacter dumoffii]MCW8454555.1 MFS transporter [Fluoribacter dumoffii]MCW8461369.1 MFS transporter [Fluoribacter dumoffii]MCW8484810.1 MFS transporter [Fluoribacter dumoffii]
MFALLSHRLNLLPKLSKTCYLLLLFSFLECAAGGIAYYLSLYLGTSTPLTKLQIGQVGSIVGFGALSGALCSTYITDRLNSKNIIVISLLFLGLSFFCLPQSANFLAISGCAFIIGIATSMFLTTNNTLLLQKAPQDQNSLRLVQSMKVVSENLGNSCSILLIMFFAAQYYGQIFEVIGLFFLFFALNAMKYLSVRKAPLEHSPNEGKETNQQENNKRLYITLSAVFIAGIIYAQQRIAYPLFLNEKFSSFIITAILFWLDPIIVSFFQVKITKIVSALKIHHQLAIGGLLLGTGLFTLTVVSSVGGAILACLTFILGEMLFMPTSFVQCYESAGNKRKGMATGAWRSAYSSGLVVGPTLSGFLMEYYSYNACWILAGILGFFLFILFFFQEKSLNTI